MIQRLSRRLTECNLIIEKAKVGSAPFGTSNNTQQKLRPIISMTKVIYKMPESSCALARQNQRSNWFCLEFSFVTFLCFKTKKGKNITLQEDND